MKSYEIVFIFVELEKQFYHRVRQSELVNNFPLAKDLNSHKYENPLARMIRPLWEYVMSFFDDENA